MIFLLTVKAISWFNKLTNKSYLPFYYVERNLAISLFVAFVDGRRNVLSNYLSCTCLRKCFRGPSSLTLTKIKIILELHFISGPGNISRDMLWTLANVLFWCSTEVACYLTDFSTLRKIMFTILKNMTPCMSVSQVAYQSKKWVLPHWFRLILGNGRFS